MKRHLIGLLTAVFTIAALTACAPGANTAAMTSAQVTPENPLELRLAHNLNDRHPTSQALSAFADEVEEQSEGRIVIRTYGNGQLGSETQVLAQLRQGIVDMTRVSAPGLANYDPGYHAFGLPYMFESEEEYYRVMDSPEMAEYFRSTVDDGFVGLTYYTSGARSFYTAATPIRTPADITGLKIRVQDMRSQTELIDQLGAAPIVMAFGDIYTSLQTGLIDGAESNETALTLSAHGEVAKVFSKTEHTRIPDMLVISSDTWERLTPEDQEMLTAAARRSTEEHKVAWAESIDQATVEAEEMGVEFIEDVDTEAFQEATAPVIDRYVEEYPEVAELVTVIEEARR